MTYVSCPVCLGEKIVNSQQCSNCGGQTMGGIATGCVQLNKEGNPCKHIYKIKSLGRCYVEYTCTLCTFKFPIDSGD